MTGLGLGIGATSTVAGVAGIALAPVVVRLVRRSQRAQNHAQNQLSFGMVAVAAFVPGLVVAAAVGRHDTVGLVAVPLAIWGVAAVLVDVGEQRLPDALTVPLAAATAASVAIVGTAEPNPQAALHALVGALLLGGGALLAKAVRSAAIGWGDVKLLPSLGAVLGWSGTIMLGVIAWALLLGVSVALTPRTRGDAVIPYGPALLAGTLGTAILAG